MFSSEIDRVYAYFDKATSFTSEVALLIFHGNTANKIRKP